MDRTDGWMTAPANRMQQSPQRSKWRDSLLPNITRGWKQKRKRTDSMGQWGHLSWEGTFVPKEGAPGTSQAG